MSSVKEMLNNYCVYGEWFPLPDWASAYNHDLEPVQFAQLYTLDGRRSGNAVISDIYSTSFGTVYVVVTDMGSVIRMTKSEMLGMFEVGVFLIKEEGVERRLGKKEPV